MFQCVIGDSIGSSRLLLHHQQFLLERLRSDRDGALLAMLQRVVVVVPPLFCVPLVPLVPQ